MRSPTAGLLSPSPTLNRGGSGSFRTCNITRPRLWTRRCGWTALLVVAFTWLGLQLLLSHRHQDSGAHTQAPKFWQDNPTSDIQDADVPPLPPSARPDFREEDSICAGSSEKCAAIQQAKEQSYREFRAQQLASELSPEQPISQLNVHPSLSSMKKRKGIQLFQLLTSRFRRRATLPECAALERISPHLRTIAIVGNGPLSAQQRHQIQQADIVMRFNKLNNRWSYPRMASMGWRHPALPVTSFI